MTSRPSNCLLFIPSCDLSVQEQMIFSDFYKVATQYFNYNQHGFHKTKLVVAKIFSIANYLRGLSGDNSEASS